MKPVLGSKNSWEGSNNGWETRPSVDEEKPESRRLFSRPLDEIVEATARGYEKAVEELEAAKERPGERGTDGSDLSRPPIGRSQA